MAVRDRKHGAQVGRMRQGASPPNALLDPIRRFDHAIVVRDFLAGPDLDVIERTQRPDLFRSRRKRLCQLWPTSNSCSRRGRCSGTSDGSDRAPLVLDGM